MRYLTLLFFCFLSINASSQTFTNAVSYGTADEDYGLHIRVDNQGNVYTLGGYEGTIDFGNGKTLTATGDPALGLFITKHNANGELQWVFNGGTDGEKLFYLDLDAAGNIYVSGSFIGTQTFGGQTFTTDENESNDNFLMKVKPDGTLAWVRHLRGPDHEHVQGLAVTDNGDIFISGFFDATYTYEGTTFTNKGSSDIFVMKFDTDNNFMWGIANGSTGLDWPWDLAVDNNGNLALAATYNATFSWDGVPVTHAGGNDMLIVGMNTNDGSTNFVKNYGNTANDEAKGVAYDAAGNLYVSGYYINSITLGTDEIISAGSADGILIKLNSSGDYQWAKSFGGTFVDNRIVKPVVYNNQVYLGGSLIGTVTAGQNEYISAGSRDIFLVAYTTSGAFVNAAMLGGNRADNLGGIGINANGKLWITGDFSSETLTLGSTVLTNTAVNNPDIFIAEISDFTTGINQVASLSNVQLYPNPAHDFIVVVGESLQQVEVIEIRDITGSLLFLETITDQQGLYTINTQSLASGVYYITIDYGFNKQNVIFIKE